MTVNKAVAVYSSALKWMVVWIIPASVPSSRVPGKHPEGVPFVKKVWLFARHGGGSHFQK